MAIGAIGNVFLNAVLIPLYGITGAATATTTARILFVIVTVYLLKKVLAIKFDSFWYVKIGTLVGVSAILFYTLAFLNRFLSSVIALLLYAIVVMKYLLAKEDRDYFVSIIKSIIHRNFTKL